MHLLAEHAVWVSPFWPFEKNGLPVTPGTAYKLLADYLSRVTRKPVIGSSDQV